MKWLVALFAVVIFVAKVSCQQSGLSDADMVKSTLCTADYQCKDGCSCESPRMSVPKMCFCYPHDYPHGKLVCRRSEYL